MRSTLEYDALVWNGSLTPVQRSEFERVKNRALRISILLGLSEVAVWPERETAILENSW